MTAEMPAAPAAPAANARTARPAAIALLVGVAVMIGAAFLKWFDFTIEGVGTDEVAGLDVTMGMAVVGLAIIVGILGIIFLVRGRGRVLASFALALSLIALGISAFASFAIEDAVASLEAKEVGDQLGISEDQAQDALEEGFESGQLNAEVGPGPYAALGGSALAVVATILGIVTGGRRREDLAPAAPAYTGQPVPPPPPPGAGRTDTGDSGYPPPPE